MMKIGTMARGTGLALLASVLLLLSGCDVGVANSGIRRAADLGGSDSVNSALGIPCAIDTILTTYCHSCHGTVPSGGAAMPLVTRSDLAASSSADPGLTFAPRSLARMILATSPMPPKPASAVTAADQTTFAAWVSSNLPGGACQVPGDGGGGPSDPLNAAATCTSNATNRSGEGPNMAPGQACNACHASRGREIFAIAGTVFASGHEPDNCNGASGAAAAVAQAEVVIVDAQGNSQTVGVDTPSGNFTISGSIATPYTAKVVYQGKERVMVTPQSSGDCNGCHSQGGTSTSGGASAPGRITLPF